jgi:hypothetical protein
MPPPEAAADAAALRRACALLDSCAQARAVRVRDHACVPPSHPCGDTRVRITPPSQLLDLPEGAALTAAAYLLRYHAARRGSEDALSYEALVPACLFLATKVRET